jgi:hypothetical protein
MISGSRRLSSPTTSATRGDDKARAGACNVCSALPTMYARFSSCRACCSANRGTAAPPCQSWLRLRDLFDDNLLQRGLRARPIR